MNHRNYKGNTIRIIRYIFQIQWTKINKKKLGLDLKILINLLINDQYCIGINKRRVNNWTIFF